MIKIIMQLYKKPFIPLIVKWGKRIEAQRFKEPPVFIGGCARSGTTILLSILSSHKDIFASRRELDLFAMVDEEPSGNIKPLRMDRIYRCMIINSIGQNAKRWCEKTPRNVLHIESINRYFNGNFRFIHIIRDGRDVILSRHPQDKNRYWVSPERWIRDVSKGLEYKDDPRVHTITYEDLILNFEKTITGICSFLNISLSAEILDWHKNATVTRNDAYESKVQELSANSIGKWRQPQHSKRVELLMNHPEGSRLLQELGYH